MARAALIIVDAEPPRLFGFEWVELCARRLTRVGVAQTVVVANRTPAALVTAIDRLRRDGIAVTLVREGAQAADLFHPDEDVILLTGRHLAPAERVDALLAAGAPAIACVSADADEGFERIDAETRWAGFALFDGTMVRATAAIVGDWDLASTLLRAAVQAGATRIVVSPDPPDLAEPSALRTAARAMLDEGALASSGWGDRVLIAPLAGRLAIVARHWAATIVAFAPGVTLALAVLCVALAVRAWPATAAVTLIVAMLVQAIGEQWARVVASNDRWRKVARLGIGVAGSAALLAIAAQASERNMLLVLAAVVIAHLILRARLNARGGDAAWAADIPGNALVLLIGACIGGVGIGVALVVVAIHGLVSVALAQNSLSRVLTPSG